MSNDLNAICTVSVTLGTATPTVESFSIPLILSCKDNGTSGAVRVKTWTAASDMLTANSGPFLETDPEYVYASQIFAQSPSIPSVKTGHLSNQPEQLFYISLADLGAGNGTTAGPYNFAVGGEQISVAGLASNDNLIASGVALCVTALGTYAALGGDSYTAVADTALGAGKHRIQIAPTSSLTGKWLPVDIESPPSLLNVQQMMVKNGADTDPGVGTDLTAIADEDNTFYGVLCPWNSYAMAKGVATWAETNGKLFIAGLVDSSAATSDYNVSTTTDFASKNKAQAHTWTGTISHGYMSEAIDAAYLGRFFAYDPGSEFWNNKTLSGVTPDVLSATYKTYLADKQCTFYVAIGGLNVCQGGKVGDSSYEWIDVRRGVDWLVARIQERTYALLYNSTKVPYTDTGIALIEGQVRSVLSDGILSGLLSANPAPLVTAPKAKDIAAADKANRTLQGLKFTATLAGAIKAVSIQGLLVL